MFKMEGVAPLERLTMLPPAGMTPEMVPAMVNYLTSEQIRVLADAPPTVGGIFPNFALFRFPFLSSDMELAGVIGMHAFVPKGPESVEFWHWSLVEQRRPG